LVNLVGHVGKFFRHIPVVPKFDAIFNIWTLAFSIHKHKAIITYITQCVIIWFLTIRQIPSFNQTFTCL